MSFWQKVKAPFKSYKGLTALLFGYEFILVLFLSTFSKPMVDRFGEALPMIFPLMDMDPARHADRVIMLYHAIAIPFMVVLAFIILDWYASRPQFEVQAKWGLFFGALITSIAAMDFAYGSEHWVSHGIFIFGQGIVFYSAFLMVIAIWPTKNFPKKADDETAELSMIKTKGGYVSWEYLNMSLTGIAILISALIGAIAGSAFGQPDQYDATMEEYPNPYLWLPRLMETIPRRDDHNIGWSYHEMVVAHLHIMLALGAGLVLLLTLRKSNMKESKFTFMGKEMSWFNISQWLYTPGVVILAIGAWLVVTPLSWAHVVINVGAGFLLMVGGIVACYGWYDIARKHLGDKYEETSHMGRVKASFSDPVKWTLFFQLWWVNIVSTFPGVYVAFNLDAESVMDRNFRGLEMIDVEYSFNVGHWHVLGVLIGIMVVMFLVDEYDIKGKLRQAIGWLMLSGSIIGFGFTTIYMLREPDEELAMVQDPLTDILSRANEIETTHYIENLFLWMDIGIGLMYVAIAAVAVVIAGSIIKNKNETLE